MICPKCGAEVPAELGWKGDNQLVCDCFRIELDTELERKNLEAFAQRGGPLYLTSALSSHYHLLPTERRAITLCRKKRYMRPETRTIFAAEIRKKGEQLAAGAKPDWCMECLTKALQSANAGRSQTVTESPAERQPQSGKSL